MQSHGSATWSGLQMLSSLERTYSKQHTNGCVDIEGTVVRPMVPHQQMLGPVRAVLKLLYQLGVFL